jgi:hypothetical protein
MASPGLSPCRPDQFPQAGQLHSPSAAELLQDSLDQVLDLILCRACGQTCFPGELHVSSRLHHMRLFAAGLPTRSGKPQIRRLF